MTRISPLAALSLVTALATSALAEGPLDLDALFAEGPPPEPEVAHEPPTWGPPSVRRVARYAPLGPGHPAIDLWRVEVTLSRPDGEPFGSPRARPEGSVWPSYAPDLLALEGGLGPSVVHPSQPGRVTAFVPATVDTSGESWGELVALLDQTSDEVRPRSGRVDLTRYPVHSWTSEGLERFPKPSRWYQGALMLGEPGGDASRGGGSSRGLEYSFVVGGGELVQVLDQGHRLVSLRIDGTPPPEGVTWILRAEEGEVLGTISVDAGATAWPPAVLRLPEPDFQGTVHVQILPHAELPVAAPEVRKTPGPFMGGTSASALFGLGSAGVREAGFLVEATGD